MRNNNTNERSVSRRRAAALGTLAAVAVVGWAAPVTPASAAQGTTVQAQATTVAPVSGLRTVSATTEQITVAWTASPTPNVEYRLYLNGRLANQTSGTVGSVTGVYLYPGPGFATGTAPKKGRNVVGVQAVSIDPATRGVTSPIVEITVRL